MRDEHGPLVPVELAPGIPGTLVIGHREAVKILTDPRFSSDPRRWQQNWGDQIPPDCPVLPMMAHRRQPMRADGDYHRRLRGAATVALRGVELLDIADRTREYATVLLNNLCGHGYADLRAQYVVPLIGHVFDHVLGFPPESSQRASSGTAAVLDGHSGASVEAGMQQLVATVAAVVAGKQKTPGDDVISRMLAYPGQDPDQPHKPLTLEEVTEGAMLLHAAGSEATTNMVLNVLLNIFADPQGWGGIVQGGGLSVRDAIERTLSTDPPLPQFCTRYPSGPQVVGGVELAPDMPVVTSLLACNNDPAAFPRAAESSGNRAHLAWGAGPHICPGPAQELAITVTTCVIEEALDVVPDMQLSEEVVWRPGVFTRAPEALPVKFPKTPPMPTISGDYYR
ncbi:cytochrome P450 [Nocardia sp. CNY236]|uniref:cytochrome P450 n=1 Tax=Nocardia sp. CNY236 TaxID=1169152 RepID=UPI000401FF27|nr:cytochrome P450 [Nocardia sp. CNY236]